MKRLLTVLIVLAIVDPASVAAQRGVPQGRGGGAGGRAAGAGQRLPPRDARERERETGTAIIQGRIVTADTGAPIRRAQVRATSASRENRLVQTDAQGAFEFRDLPAGRWDLTASKAGFVTMRFGQRRPFEAGRPIELADGQAIERVIFTLPRGAAITGRVLDEFGDPVANARVQALRYQVVQGTRRLNPVGVVSQSDDTGAFRLYGLMPGEYYVSAILRALPFEQDSDDANGYAPTYYPGTGNVAEAQAVTLEVAQEANVSFALLPVRTVRISGTVLTSTGAPLAGGMVMLAPNEPVGGGRAIFMVGGGNRIRPDGTFSLTNVAPGSYRLTATNAAPGPGRAMDAEFEMGWVPVTTGGEDLTGITVVTTAGARLSGTVAAARGSSGTFDPRGVQVNAQPVPPEPGFGGFARPMRVEADGTFTLTNLFGSRLIRVNGLPQDWALEAVLVDGRDMTDTPIEFGPNDEVTDVQILVTNRVTEVSGGVNGPDGKPSPDFTVVVFPDDERKWVAPTRYVRSARPDQDGLFKIRALPPGSDYLAVALDYLEDGAASDPEFLGSIKAIATKFRLGAGESATVNLKLVER